MHCNLNLFFFTVGLTVFVGPMMCFFGTIRIHKPFGCASVITGFKHWKLENASCVPQGIPWESHVFGMEDFKLKKRWCPIDYCLLRASWFSGPLALFVISDVTSSEKKMTSLAEQNFISGRYVLQMSDVYNPGGMKSNKIMQKLDEYGLGYLPDWCLLWGVNKIHAPLMVWEMLARLWSSRMLWLKKTFGKESHVLIMFCKHQTSTILDRITSAFVASPQCTTGWGTRHWTVCTR